VAQRLEAVRVIGGGSNETRDIGEPDRTRDPIDLALVIALTLACILFVLTPRLNETPVRVLLGLLLGLFLPGYSLVAAPFPRKDDLACRGCGCAAGVDARGGAVCGCGGGIGGSGWGVVAIIAVAAGAATAAAVEAKAAKAGAVGWREWVW